MLDVYDYLLDVIQSLNLKGCVFQPTQKIEDVHIFVITNKLNVNNEDLCNQVIKTTTFSIKGATAPKRDMRQLTKDLELIQVKLKTDFQSNGIVKGSTKLYAINNFSIVPLGVDNAQRFVSELSFDIIWE